MTEQLGHHHERKHTPETHVETPKHHESEKRPDKHHEKAKTAEKHYNKHELEQLAKHVAKRSHETPIEESEKPVKTQFGIQRDLKLQAYKQTLQKIRPRLSPAGRTFSKVIHQPTVEAISEVGSKTIARPSGVLGGGFMALVGGSAVLFISKYFGFEYNFFVYLLFLIIGFFGGIFMELIISGIRPKSRKS